MYGRNFCFLVTMAKFFNFGDNGKVSVKPLKRVLGVDDGPFDRERDTETFLVGVLARFDGYVEGVAARSVEVDGMNSTEQVLSIFHSNFATQADYIILDGVTFAGFNICDITEIHLKTGKPVVSVTRKMPDVEDMKSALKRHFEDHETRTGILEKTDAREIRLKSGNTVYANTAGISEKDAGELIGRSIIRGNVPEPVRLAHMIAGAMKSQL